VDARCVAGRGPWLQWGRGFVAAEAGISKPSEKKTAWLQWGRGFVAAEADVAVYHAPHPARASMGPRLCSRGDRDAGPAAARGAGAFNGAAAL